MVLPHNVYNVIDCLERAGYEAWAVGGCVRDSYLGRTPKDYDVASSCPPQTVCKLFSHCIPTGLAYGTVTVFIQSLPIEVTVFRQESEYNDKRHPGKVLPASNITTDLSRRDFTVNAMAWHPNRGLCDPFNGQNDLNQHLMRTVGDAYARFSEDALRILRLFRFASQLDFDIEQHTQQAALNLAPTLQHISVERITAELSRLLIGSRPEMLACLVDAGGLSHIGLRHLPNAILLRQIPAQLPLRLTALLWLCKANTNILHTLRLDNKTIHQVNALLVGMKSTLPADAVQLKHAFSVLPPEQWQGLLRLRSVLLNEDTHMIQQLLIKTKGQPWNRSMLAISGNELRNQGYSGTKVGDILAVLLEYIIQHPELNTPDKLIDIVKNMRNV